MYCAEISNNQSLYVCIDDHNINYVRIIENVLIRIYYAFSSFMITHHTRSHLCGITCISKEYTRIYMYVYPDMGIEGGRYYYIYVYYLWIVPGSTMYPGTPGILRRNGVGRYTCILLLHVYTIPIYPGLPVYPGTPGILRRMQWGWTIYSYNYFMCPSILCPGLQNCPRIVHVSRDS